MNKPIVIPWQAWWPFSIIAVEKVAPWLLEDVPWLTVRSARHECFMARGDVTYNYGTPPHDQTYTATGYHPLASTIEDVLNEDYDASYNVCFLNRYDDEKQQLGWHSDDSPGMDLDHPIAVVSFGEPREIWVREKGATGVVPKEDRYLLSDGSLFIMPANYQRTHQHRIPKGDRKMGTRISLTYRHYVPTKES